MNELSIFVDESGDFGRYDYHSPYYIISMIMHNQSIDLSPELNKLNIRLAQMGYPNHCIHSGPIIRQEDEYHFISLSERQKIFKTLVSFLRNIDFKFTTFYIDKKQIADKQSLSIKLSNQISTYMKSNYSFFLSYDAIKIYYDNGQTEVSKLLATVFHTLMDNVEFRKVIPTEYRLFQVADLICTLKLIELKMNNHTLSKSELLFFQNERTLKKNYLKPLNLKKL